MVLCPEIKKLNMRPLTIIKRFQVTNNRELGCCTVV